MGIFDRMGKVISSNMNALLERAEDDKKLLELNIEEMEAQLRSGQEDVVAAVASEKQLRKKSDNLLVEIAKWDKRAELAVKGDDEDLAREALKQKKRLTDEMAEVDRARAEQRDTALRMRDELERMRRKLEDVKLRKGTIAARAEQSRAGGTEIGARGGSSAFARFRELEERIEGREAEGSAMAEVEAAIKTGPSDKELEAQFRDLERGTTRDGKARDAGIEGELDAIKKRIRV